MLSTTLLHPVSASQNTPCADSVHSAGTRMKADNHNAALMPIALSYFFNDAGQNVVELPLELAVALVEQPLFSVGVEHTILESALPLVLHPLDLVISA